MGDVNSLLGHCLARAALTWGSGRPIDVLRYTPRASRLCAFVALWATLLDEGDVDAISIEDYARAGFDSRATSYRRLADFRELFPEERDPNRIALAVAREARRRRVAPSAQLSVAI